MLIKYKTVIMCTLRLVGGGAEKKKTNLFTPPPTTTEDRTAHKHQIGVGMLPTNSPACLPAISIELVWVTYIHVYICRCIIYTNSALNLGYKTIQPSNCLQLVCILT